MLDKLKKTPGRVEAITLIDAHLEEHPGCQCVESLRLALAKLIVAGPIVVG